MPNDNDTDWLVKAQSFAKEACLSVPETVSDVF